MSDRFERFDDSDDVELAQALAALDPGSLEPAYWSRFEDWVMASAGPALARRRATARVTVPDVLFSWARALVPTALAAATIAGLALLRAQPTHVAPQPLGIEELLVSEIDGPAIPWFLAPDSPINSRSFLSEIF